MIEFGNKNLLGSALVETLEGWGRSETIRSDSVPINGIFHSRSYFEKF